MKKTVAAALMLVASIAQGQALQGRDLNGDGSFDAYYDSAQNISWLADANYYATLGNPSATTFWGAPAPAGQVRYQTAVTWVSSLTVYGVDSWRLPARIVPIGSDDPRCGDTSCDPVTRWPSELGGLAAVLAGAPTPFLNVQNGSYMTSTYGGWLEYRGLTGGYVETTNATSLFTGYVLPVHNGDVGALITASVAPVPEPSTYAMMLLALGVLGFSMKRRRQA